MIPEDLKKPPTLSINIKEMDVLDNLLQNALTTNGSGNATPNFSRRQLEVLHASLCFNRWLGKILQYKGVGVGIIRKVLNIVLPKSSNTTNNNNSEQDKDKDKDKEKDHDNGSSSDVGNTGTGEDNHNHSDEDGNDKNDNKGGEPNDSNSSQGTGPGSRPNHNGKRGPDDIQFSALLDHYHDKLRPGDPCLKIDCTGKVYVFLRDGEPRKVITFDFSPPFEATLHQMHDLRCNVCLEVYKVSLPEELIKDGASNEQCRAYLYPAQAALSLLHYGMGMPFYRLDQFQSFTGERFPESTQFDILEKVANSFKRLTDAMKQAAANGFLVQGDDVESRVLDLSGELRERRSGNGFSYREGIYTSILISTTNDGRLIPILKTNLGHFGELLDMLMPQRNPDLPAPFLVCDASKVNTSDVAPLITGGCWQHAQDYFHKAADSFPEETVEIKKLFKKIFEIDRETHDMDAYQRLGHLKKEGLPVVEKIKEIVDAFETDKIALPKSELGQAIQYFQNQYQKLLLPFEAPGVVIHNNISEWCTYLIVRLMTNSKFYKTKAGAAVGDTIIMVILFSLLNLLNPYEYLLYCLRHQEKMKRQPEDFFPWKLEGKVRPLPKNKDFYFWSPPPPMTSARGSPE